MKQEQYIFTSLTRISDLERRPFESAVMAKEKWSGGDYVIARIVEPVVSSAQLELPNGRMRGVIGGELVVGALGDRFATLEATGSWREVREDGRMSILTGAGLMGACTSKSAFIKDMVEVRYLGHVIRHGKKVCMANFVMPMPVQDFNLPVVLFVGTSMSAGKTTSARIVTGIFKRSGYKVVGAKLTGAGRYKDILAIKDVGADEVFDFVDVGLPSSICPAVEYRERLRDLLSMITASRADIAIIEIGASPLEPYNGDIAINALRDHIKCTVLSASDPYAVYGLTKAFDIRPDIVTGIASNTLAGIAMVEKLCGLKALNLIDASNLPELVRILSRTTGIPLHQA